MSSPSQFPPGFPPPGGSAGTPLPDGKKSKRRSLFSRGPKKTSSPSGDPNEKAVTRRAISTNQKAAVALLIVVAIVVFLALSSATKKSGVYVVRASQPIAAFSQIGSNQLEAIQIDKAYVEPGAFSASSGQAALKKARKVADGTNTRVALTKNQQVHPDMFSAAVDPSTPLAANERLMSLAVEPARALGGSLQAGDRVDIVMSADGDPAEAAVVASNVEIVAVQPGENLINQAASQQAVDTKKTPSQVLPSQPIPGIYTLRIDVGQVTLFAAVSGQELFFILRGANADNTIAPATNSAAAACGTAPSSPAGASAPGVICE